MINISEALRTNIEKGHMKFQSPLIPLMILLVVFTSFSYGKRKEPVEVPPIIHGDFVYTVPHWSTENNTEQNGGYVRVLDAQTGTEVWGIQVYNVDYDDSLETDVQDIFITSIELNFWRTQLIVRNEAGQEFRIDLNNRVVVSD